MFQDVGGYAVEALLSNYCAGQREPANVALKNHARPTLRGVTENCPNQGRSRNRLPVLIRTAHW
eukprot:11146815-Lingulodinium_polyedra.AAC.1